MVPSSVVPLPSCFNTQPPEGSWGQSFDCAGFFEVSTHSRPKAAGRRRGTPHSAIAVSTHSRPKAAGVGYQSSSFGKIVSTHSRPKAAGYCNSCSACRKQTFQHTAARRQLGPTTVPRASISSFNTQPPEGSWIGPAGTVRPFERFNTQPPEGSWVVGKHRVVGIKVSTHSRPKAAGWGVCRCKNPRCVSTHSRPKAAGSGCVELEGCQGGFNTQPPEGSWFSKNALGTFKPKVSTHSRPKAAGSFRAIWRFRAVCFNTQPPEGSWVFWAVTFKRAGLFQHTAARRQLESDVALADVGECVSTHSRPKAAG